MIITDGDVRRILAESGDVLARPVSEWMTQKPIVHKASAIIGQALRVMEDRASQTFSIARFIGYRRSTIGSATPS